MIRSNSVGVNTLQAVKISHAQSFDTGDVFVQTADGFSEGALSTGNFDISCYTVHYDGSETFNGVETALESGLIVNAVQSGVDAFKVDVGFDLIDSVVLSRWLDGEEDYFFEKLLEGDNLSSTIQWTDTGVNGQLTSSDADATLDMTISLEY
ncbi:Uncharacterised protein [BD1-7 clade bacterium]|uniref:Uncharacterized protein n=1 Tax=BD1-7 clade bacterium TaxID=2029982 RepID=A0A5S9Q8P5_9GAMM|nr:Uncharacterised protein [BD1-7 clade bacterium]CAA0114674.1 Uncharacterised protein [BD1-7 clade bacterium]